MQSIIKHTRWVVLGLLPVLTGCIDYEQATSTSDMPSQRVYRSYESSNYYYGHPGDSDPGAQSQYEANQRAREWQRAEQANRIRSQRIEENNRRLNNQLQEEQRRTEQLRMQQQQAHQWEDQQRLNQQLRAQQEQSRRLEAQQQEQQRRLNSQRAQQAAYQRQQEANHLARQRAEQDAALAQSRNRANEWRSEAQRAREQNPGQEEFAVESVAGPGADRERRLQESERKALERSRARIAREAL